MRSYKELAEMTGTTVDDVRTFMRVATTSDTERGRRLLRNQKCSEACCFNWVVGITATGCIGAGRTKEEAVIYALEHNSQYANVL